MSPEGALVLASLPQLTKLIVCTASVFAKLAMRESSDGIVVVFASKEKTMDDLARVNEGFYVVVESIEKPGNLGALIRTADGAGCSGILCVGQSVEAFNPQVIRSSLGTVFSVPVVVTNQADALKFLREQRCSLYAAALSPQSQSLWKTSFVGRCALVLGSEAFGLSDFWLNVCDAHVAIPMCGVADSLNVSVAAAVFMYEYRRQYS
jgi:TrmH family RNA methyltransferase